MNTTNKYFKTKNLITEQSVRNGNQAVKIYIPTNVNLLDLLEQYNCSDLLKFSERIEHFLSGLYVQYYWRQQSLTDTVKKIIRPAFLQRNQRKMRERYGYVKIGGKKTWLWSRMIEFLVKSSLVEVDRSFEIGKRSRGYRLSKKLCNKKWFQKTISDKIFIKKLKVEKVRDLSSLGDRELKLVDILKNSMSFDLDKVRSIIHSETDTVVKEIMDFQLQALLDNDYWTDITYGRFNYNLSSLKKELRKEILIDGKNTVEIDWSACHPNIVLLLNVMLLNKSLEEQVNIILRLLKAGSLELLQHISESLVPSLKGSGNNSKKQGTGNIFPYVGNFLEKFARDLSEGTFYDRFLEIINSTRVRKKLDLDRLDESQYLEVKTDMKVKFLQWINMRKPSNWRNNKDIIAFEQRYGNILEPIYLTEAIGLQLDGWRDSRQVTELLFRIESSVTGEVIDELLRLGIKCGWIYDGIIVKRDDSELASKIMGEILNKYFPIQQIIKMKGDTQ